jgi:hypothetical protein
MLINGSVINGSAINAAGGASSAVLFPKKTIISRRYTCTITGAADSLADVVIPISSINGRLNSSGVSALNIVCPNGVDYAGAILARAQGSFIIAATEYYLDGSSEVSDSQEFGNLAIAYQQGSRNYSVSIRGERAVTLHNPARKIAIQGMSYTALQANGFRRLRCNNDKDFLPGDTAILPDGEEVLINVVTYVISAANHSMELSEG